jgi:hypothetical protein
VHSPKKFNFDLWFSRFSRTQGQEQCDEDERIKMIKNHLDIVKKQLETLKDALEEIECPLKAPDRNEKSKSDDDNTPAQQKKSALKSPEVASTTISTTKKAPVDVCPFTPLEGVKKNITCFLSDV